MLLFCSSREHIFRLVSEGRMFLGSVVQCAFLSVLTDSVRTFQAKFLAGWKSPCTVLMQIK